MSLLHSPTLLELIFLILKLKKFIIFLVCVILVVSLFTFSVSADVPVDVRNVVYLNSASATVLSTNPSFYETSPQRYTPDLLRSPTGGTFYGFSWNGTKSYDMESYTQNMYFDSYPYSIKRSEVYRIKLNVVLPLGAAVWTQSPEYNVSHTLFFDYWHLWILDSTGAIRFNRNFFDDNVIWWDQLDPLNSPYGFFVDNCQSSVSGNSAQFFFIPFEFTFCASENYTLNHINFGFSFRGDEAEIDYTLNSGGYYGISDFTIEKLDPSNIGSIIFDSVDTIKNTTSDIYNELIYIGRNVSDLPSDIQKVLRSEITYLLNEQRKMYQDYKNSFNEAFNKPKYDEVDDSDVNREHQLTSEIEDLTESGRDVAVETIDSAGEILSNSVTDPSDQSGSSIENGLFVWTRILDTVFQRVPWFGTMVQFSLSLGLFSFLMGIITYSVGKTSNKNNHNKNNSKSTTPALKKGK